MTGRMPTYVDAPRLCEELSISERTAEMWVKQAILPAPHKVGRKRLWKWKEVVQRIEGDPALMPSSADEEAARITEATRHAITSKR